MPLIRRSAPLALSALLLGLAGAARTPHARIPDVDASPGSAQTARIHAHFDSVLAELDSRHVADLSIDQRARRNRLIGVLRAYDARGLFPNNYDFAEPTPYFVDRTTGVRCAVAHLLEATGRHDIVQRVARADNNVRASQLSGDSAFTAWLDAQGLTLAEAARIQPAYDGDRGGGVGAGTVVAVVGGSLLAVGSAVGTSIWNSSGNADGHNRFGNVLGIVSGTLTTVVGAVVAGSGEGGAVLGGAATAAVGVLSVARGIRGSARRSRSAAEARDAARSSSRLRGEREATIVPLIGVGRAASTGVSLRISF